MEAGLMLFSLGGVFQSFRRQVKLHLSELNATNRNAVQKK